MSQSKEVLHYCERILCRSRFLGRREIIVHQTSNAAREQGNHCPSNLHCSPNRLYRAVNKLLHGNVCILWNLKFLLRTRNHLPWNLTATYAFCEDRGFFAIKISLSIKTCIATRIGWVCVAINELLHVKCTHSVCAEMVNWFTIPVPSQHHLANPNRRVTVLGKKLSQVTFKIKTTGVVEKTSNATREIILLKRTSHRYQQKRSTATNHHSTLLKRQMYSISNVSNSSFNSILPLFLNILPRQTFNHTSTDFPQLLLQTLLASNSKLPPCVHPFPSPLDRQGGTTHLLRSYHQAQIILLIRCKPCIQPKNVFRQRSWTTQLASGTGNKHSTIGAGMATGKTPWTLPLHVFPSVVLLYLPSMK